MKTITIIPMLAFCASSLFLDSCSPGGAGEQAAATADLETEVETLRKQKSNLENQLKLMKEDYEKSYKEALKQADDTGKSEEQVKGSLEKAQEETEKIRQEFKEYREKYKVSIRQKAKGLQVAVLSTTDGKSFENITVADVSAKELKVRHSQGAATILLSHLPPDWQAKLAYDPQEEQRLEEEAQAAAQALADLKGSASAANEMPTLGEGHDITKLNPMAINTFRARIRSREEEISLMQSRVNGLKNGRGGISDLGRIQMRNYEQRLARAQQDLIALRNRMDRYIEVNSRVTKPKTTVD
jgi:hypothetical protein